ncbi:MAG: hypothetical protein ABI852_13155, partial [Gemmatimonadaceae bacterium]
PRKIPWSAMGKIAAVLVFAVAIAKSGFMLGDDVVVPTSATSREAPAQVAATAQSAPAADAAGPARAERENVASAPKVQDKKSAPAQVAANQKLASRKQPAPAEPAATIAAASPPPQVESRAVAAPTVAQEQAQAAGTGNAARALRVAAGGARSDTTVLAPMPVTAPAAERSIALSTIVTSVAQVTDSSADKARDVRPQLSGKVAGTQISAVPGAPMPTSPRAGFAKLVAPVARAPFDSVTLNRTVCATACESTVLHVNALGEVRLAAGEGNAQRVVMATLSASERDSLSALVIRTFPDAALRFGRTTCDVRDKEALRLTIDYAVKLPARADNRCGKSNDALRRLGATLDSIAGFDALKLRLPRKE